MHDKVREREPFLGRKVYQTNTLSIVPSQQSDIRGKLIVNLEARPQSVERFHFDHGLNFDLTDHTIEVIR